MSKVIVIAPHPDDELLGCGGTLLRRKNEGATLGWVIMTKISEDYGWSTENVRERENEIEQVRKRLGIQPEHLFQLGFATTRLDTFPMEDLITKVSEVSDLILENINASISIPKKQKALRKARKVVHVREFLGVNFKLFGVF